MLKKVAFYLFLSFLTANCAFAQIPLQTSQKRDTLLVYNPAKDKPEVQYLWGALYDYENFNYDRHYGLDQIIKTGKVLFTLKEDGVKEKSTNLSNKEQASKNDLENKLNMENRQKDLEKLISDAFKAWFTDTKKAIEDAGRPQEFADIMPLLNRSITAKKTTEKSNLPIINFYFTTESNMHKICGSDLVAGCEGNREIILVNPYTYQKSSYYTKKSIYITLIHEIGHYLGLADQYKQGIWNVDNVYSTTDRVDKTSVMAAKECSELKCDDIDGLINLIDLTLYYQRKHWSKRAKAGWASFCNGKKYYKDTFYKEAKPVNKKGDECVYTFTPEGKIDKKYCPRPFTLRNINDTLTYNKSTGLLSKKVDAKFTYQYSYEKIDGANTVKVKVANKNMVAKKIKVDGKDLWEIPQNFAGDNRGFVYAQDQDCIVSYYMPYSDSREYTLAFGNNALLPDYKFTFTLGKHQLTLHKYETLGHPVCTVSKDKEQIVKFIGGFIDENEMNRISKSRNMLNTLSEENGITKDQVIEICRKECEREIPKNVIDNSKGVCNYFKQVDKYFASK